MRGVIEVRLTPGKLSVKERYMIMLSQRFTLVKLIVIPVVYNVILCLSAGVDVAFGVILLILILVLCLPRLDMCYLYVSTVALSLLFVLSEVGLL